MLECFRSFQDSSFPHGYLGKAANSLFRSEPIEMHIPLQWGRTSGILMGARQCKKKRIGKCHGHPCRIHILKSMKRLCPNTLPNGKKGRLFDVCSGRKRDFCGRIHVCVCVCVCVCMWSNLFIGQTSQHSGSQTRTHSPLYTQTHHYVFRQKRRTIFKISIKLSLHRRTNG